MSDGWEGRVMVPKAYREMVGQSKQRMVPGFESLPTMYKELKANTIPLKNCFYCFEKLLNAANEILK